MSRKKLHETAPQEAPARIVERADGFYRVEGGVEEGPYATIQQARDAAALDDESDFEPGETLAEAEEELGIATWVDPDTGLPAEDTPHRLEDH